jgi:four helix bundle protein
MWNDDLRARTLALQERSFALTCAIISGYPKKPYLDDPSRIVWRQLLRAASSSTFNLEEADAASSDADFLSKLRIALREAKEARVAIRIIVRCELAGHAVVGKHEDEMRQMALIFAKIIVNKRASMARRSRS